VSGRETVEVDGVAYELVAQGIRASLTDAPAMLWGFQVHVFRDGELAGVKTCFVGRVSVQVRAPDVLDAPLEVMLPVLHELAFEKVREQIAESGPGDELVFA
jgi:hypothetical protein